ncbi:MAG: hypothetical protein VX589_18835 [Myxococcota bacterium]|nr:hypothetical protein [Myxococcota bacterium]
MIKGHLHRLIYLGLILNLGCAATRIYTNQPNATIYIDGRYAGTGEAQLDNLGPPNEVEIKVVHGSQTAVRRVHRRFRFTTLLVGLCTFYTGLYWAWRYPDDVEVDLHQSGRFSQRDPSRSGNDWTQAMPATQRPSAPPAHRSGDDAKVEPEADNPWTRPYFMAD